MIKEILGTILGIYFFMATCALLSGMLEQASGGKGCKTPITNIGYYTGLSLVSDFGCFLAEKKQ